MVLNVVVFLTGLAPIGEKEKRTATTKLTPTNVLSKKTGAFHVGGNRGRENETFDFPSTENLDLDL